jgi:Ala-tRNA(Pro) deacylase
MLKTPEELLGYLEHLGVAVTTRYHPPLFTVAASQSLRGEIPGAHTKNLLLKDRKDKVFLVSAAEDAVIDLNTIHEKIGAAGRVSFAKPELLMELLGVKPGAVTLFGVINDREGRVQVVMDEDLVKNDLINAHPLTNEATTSIGSADLLRFLQATGHVPIVLKVSA